MPNHRESQVKETLGTMPGWFTENNGQVESEGIFFTSSNGNIAFLESSVLMSIPGGENLNSVKVSFMNANRVVPLGREPLGHTTSFLRGSDSSDWKQGVSNYRQVIYEGLYEGIDLLYYFNEDGLKYDWRIKPHADPTLVQEHYEGIETITIEADGSLDIRAGTGTLREERPYSYQEIGGATEEVITDYRIVEGSIVRYDIGAYDGSHELIIDPLIACTFLGGNTGEQPLDVFLDDEDNVYIAGDTYSADFPTTPGCLNRTLERYTDIYVCKFDKDLTRLEYSSVIGGNLWDHAFGIDVDEGGNAYVVGGTRSSDFPTTEGAYNRTFRDSISFAFKLSSDGTELLYSTFVPEGGGTDVVLDADRNIYIAGGGYGNGSLDAFIGKLSADGSDMLCTTHIGGSEVDSAVGIAMDSDGNLYITGDTLSTDFPTTPGCYDNVCDGENISQPSYKHEVFVTKVSPDLSQLVYSTFIGGNDSDRVDSFTLDSDDNIVIVGNTRSDNYPVTEGCYDENGTMFVTKLNHNGSALLFSTFIGHDEWDEVRKWEYARGVTLDSKGYVYITGETNAETYPTTPDCYDDSFNGGGGHHNMGDFFISVLTPDGSDLVYSTYVGGYGEEFADSMALDSDENVVVAGHFRLGVADFPTVPGCYDVAGGPYDSVFFKFRINVVPTALIETVSPGLALDTDTIRFRGSGQPSYSMYRPAPWGNITRFCWESSIDGELYNGTHVDVDLSGLSCGDHVISLKAMDQYGDWGPEVTTTLSVHKKPQARIESLYPNPALDVSAIRFTGNATDDGRITRYSWTSSIDWQLYTGMDPEFSLKDLSPGEHIISLKVLDDRGVWSDEATTTLIVHSRPVVAGATFGPDPAVTTDTVHFRGNASDDGTLEGYSWTSSIDGELYLGRDDEFNRTGLSAGAHEITLKAMDNYGVWSDEASFELLVHPQPTCRIETVSPDLALDTDTVHFKGYGNSSGTIIRYVLRSSIDGELHNGPDPEFNLTGLSPGLHVLFLKVEDSNGGWSDEVCSGLLVNTRPVSSITSELPGVVLNTDAIQLAGNGTDEGAVVMYAWSSNIDGELYTGSESEISLTGFSSGTHTLFLKAMDDQGAWSHETSTSLVVHERPTAGIDPFPQGVVLDTSAVHFAGSGTDDGTITRYIWSSSIDGALYNGTDPGFTHTGLSTGTHTIQLKVMDDNGAWSGDSSRKLTVHSRPVAVIASLTTDPMVEGENTTFAAQGTDDGTITRYLWSSSIDGILYNGTRATVELSNLSVGNHTLSLQVRDDHGEWSPEAKTTGVLVVSGAKDENEASSTPGSYLFLLLLLVLVMVLLLVSRLPGTYFDTRDPSSEVSKRTGDGEGPEAIKLTKEDISSDAFYNIKTTRESEKNSGPLSKETDQKGDMTDMLTKEGYQ